MTLGEIGRLVAQTAAQAGPTAAPLPPLISGPGEFLWTGFAGIVIVLVLVLVLLMRSRVRGASETQARVAKSERPARKEKPVKGGNKTKKDKSRSAADFFEPAGDDAEITFDDEPAPSSTARRREADEGDLALRADDESEVAIDRGEIEVTPASKAGPARANAFAGLFSKKERAADTQGSHLRAHPLAGERNRAHGDAPSAEEPAQEPQPPADARVNKRADERQSVLAEAEEARMLSQRLAEQARAESEEDDLRRALEEARFTAERDAADRARRAEQEMRARAETEARERAEHEARNRADQETRERALRETEFERRKQAAALEQRERARRTEAAALLAGAGAEEDRRRFPAPSNEPERLAAGPDPSALAALSRALDQRIADLDERLETRMFAFASGSRSDDAPDAAALAEMVSRRISEHREQINATLASLMNRLDSFAGAAEDVSALRREISTLKRAVGESAPTAAPQVQLADLVRNALPPDAYEFGAVLPNNRRADCLVRLPYPPGPIAIDARFPVEAFQALHAASETDRARADNDFRRAALRHLVDIAERLIVPEATAESALLFIPSESMYATLHERFADIVQDAYRARVWIVSPTTLMATLHTIRAVMRDAGSRLGGGLAGGEAQQVIAEVDALRRRVARLEGDTAPPVKREAKAGADSFLRRPEPSAAPRRIFDDEHRGDDERLLVARSETDHADAESIDPDPDEAVYEDDSRPTPFPLR